MFAESYNSERIINHIWNLILLYGIQMKFSKSGAPPLPPYKATPTKGQISNIL
jgi:hypothetical protein